MPTRDVSRLGADIVFAENLRGRTFTFHSTWGLFNPKRIDPGTRLLIDHIKAGPADRCLDLGCGYGPIGLALGHLCPEGEVHLIDKDFVAVDYAAQNAERNGLSNCRAYLSNAFSHVPAHMRFDTIASNLPAKTGNELLTIIMHDACARLRDGRAPVGRHHCRVKGVHQAQLQGSLRQLQKDQTAGDVPIVSGG